MRALIAASLRLRLPVVALSIILMVVGIKAASDAPFDVFPEFAPPLVEIQTEAPGLSTSDVEALDHACRSKRRMNGVPGLDVAPLEVGARPVVGRADLRERHRT